MTNVRLSCTSQNAVREINKRATPIARAELEAFLREPSNFDMPMRFVPSIDPSSSRQAVDSNVQIIVKPTLENHWRALARRVFEQPMELDIIDLEKPAFTESSGVYGRGS